MVNKIFNSCDIFLNDKDLLLVEGKRSQAKYVIINSKPRLMQMGPTGRSRCAASSQWWLSVSIRAE